MFWCKAFWDFNYNWLLRKEKEGLENLHGVGWAEGAKVVSTVSPSWGEGGQGKSRAPSAKETVWVSVLGGW